MNLKIDLNPREDKEEQIYYLGKVKFPGTIDCRNGVAFLIFISEEGEEELQIASLDKDNNSYSQYYKKHDRLKIALKPKEDQYGKLFYITKLQLKGTIDCRDGVSFIIFCSKEGQEELQIVAPVKFDKKNKWPSYIVEDAPK